jgi:hypothetical protein
MKPVQFQLPYAVMNEMKYTCSEAEKDGSLPKVGVLQPGRVVWLDHTPRLNDQTTLGFAQGIGVVELDARLLHRV